MSQQKVDRYKKEKANRKQTIKKEKRKNVICRMAAATAAVVVVGGIGYSIYHTQAEKAAKAGVQVDYTAVNELASELAGVSE